MKILCPVCGNVLDKDDKRYCCLNRHSFDIAKEGYLNLNLKSSQRSGDEKEMIRARRAFLEKDHYRFLRDRINDTVDELHAESLLDLGCGEGYYTKTFKVKDKTGIDLSKEALRIASRSDKSTFYILKNIFEIPLEDVSVDLVTTIFAPVSKEVPRVLKTGGHFLLVRPDERHLYELKRTVYDKPYLNIVEDVKVEGMVLEKEEKISAKALLGNTELVDLFKMTPYYHKTAPADFNKLKKVQNLEVNFAFIIDTFTKI